MAEPQSWRRIGLVYSPRGEQPWLRSHASLPLAAPGQGSRRTIYFAARDAEDRSHIGAVEIDLDDPLAGTTLRERPVLEPGPLGCFDDHGVYPASIVEHDGRLLLYYIGWNPGKTEPLFYSSVGLAVSEDGGETFERAGAAPLLARSEFDPCLVTSPCVRFDQGRWRMWYVSGFRWDRAEDGTPRSWYHVKHAESDDGIAWRRDGRVCVDHQHPGERNISRPCVIRDGDRYRMWFAYAGDLPYRLGYAESGDGLEWTRADDTLAIEGPGGEWDSDSRAYPWVLEHDGARFMLYNGNDLGRDGFGLAVEERT